ncbi:oligodendrocyte-myelin glycoprotein [Spea bombifrons]|uniref:oligodendrocyte-myelin glycoprotein n=1 Tax=Spea bombifrons TaxID=233779 RepID=UPI00234922B2|nr:oligodendrocyte-myelin glycoprotein [Spea bombifrons]
MGCWTNPWPVFLILLCSVPNIFSICPKKCVCFLRDRHVDCSIRNLTASPHGLQDNVTHLNFSHNHLTNLDHQLTRFTNLRSLDVSHNFLRNLPAHLPRSMWSIYASHNSINVIHKLDTVYQWNLKTLDVSWNTLQRVVLINNTLGSLQLLNLSNNQLWTVPTNMPSNIQTVDLSNNYLIQILPGTLVRLHNLQNLYLHNNRFTYIPNKEFDHLAQLKELTLYNNPWSCKKPQNILYLLKWVRESGQHIIGCPCANETITHLSSPVEESEELLDYKPLLPTSSLTFLEAQEEKTYEQVPLSMAVTLAPSIASTSVASRDEFLFLNEGSADEMINLNDSIISKNDPPLLTSIEIESMEVHDTTLPKRKGKSYNITKVTASPTASTVVPGSTVKIKNHIHSSAQTEKFLAAMFIPILLALRAI